jgi:hypothetical protein
MVFHTPVNPGFMTKLSPAVKVTGSPPSTQKMANSPDGRNLTD